LGRSNRQTADYFPHYVGEKSRTKFILEKNWGNDGYAFWFKLLELLCAADGQYYDCWDKMGWEYLLAVTGVTAETAEAILNTLASMGKVDKELWESCRVIWVQSLLENLRQLYSKRTAAPTKPSVDNFPGRRAESPAQEPAAATEAEETPPAVPEPTPEEVSSVETMTAMLDSLRPADSARSAETTQHRRPTSKDILAGGYNCQREIPEPVECEFCGRKLYHEALVMGRTVLMFAPFPQRCTCEQAKAKWAEADAEEARQKAEAEKEAAQAKRRAKIERLLGRSGIKKRFQQRTFANFIRDTPERRRCYDTAKTYADSFPQRAERGEGLYIEGTYGTGKTHLAAAIALQLIGCGVPVVCKTSGDLLADIKEAFDNSDATEYEILKAYKTVDLLIVDDLGKEQCTDWSVSTLYSILNDRYEDMKPTIITTNYNADELVRALTPKGGDGTKARAIISRLREVSTVITMAWPDYRTGGSRR